MSARILIADLDVVGYVGRTDPSDAPKRLLPIYRSRDGQRVLVPPTEESGDHLVGYEVPTAYLEALLDEEEVTMLEQAPNAQAGHLLWMSRVGPRYEPAFDAERELEDLAVDAISQTCALGLAGEGVRDLLFGALRVRPTVMANALLAVHFQLTGDIRLSRPVRDDLADLIGWDTGELDRRMLEASRPLLSSSQDLATAVAMEVRRAGRREVADSILETVPAHKRSAAEPEPPLSWSGVLRWRAA